MVGFSGVVSVGQDVQQLRHVLRPRGGAGGVPHHDAQLSKQRRHHRRPRWRRVGAASAFAGKNLRISILECIQLRLASF